MLPQKTYFNVSMSNGFYKRQGGNLRPHIQRFSNYLIHLLSKIRIMHFLVNLLQSLTFSQHTQQLCKSDCSCATFHKLQLVNLWPNS